MPFPPAVIQHLANFGAPAEQVVPINKFFECYDILLSHPACPLHQTWTETKAYLAAQNENLPLGVNTNITRNCLSGAVAVPVPNWPVIYLLTMLWGFGERDKAGSAKLFVSTKTPDVAGKIVAVAELVLAGNLVAAFNGFCVNGGDSKLHEVGKAFGTKFLFVAGMHLPPDAIRPLVFDENIKKALAALRAQFPHDLDAMAFPWFDVNNGAEYESYCSCINEAAAAMNEIEGAANVHWDAYKLEQLLFEHQANIAQAPAANAAPAQPANVAQQRLEQLLFEHQANIAQAPAANAAPAQPANVAQQRYIVAAHFQNFYARANIERAFAQNNGIALAPGQRVPNNFAAAFIVGGVQHACHWNGYGSITGNEYPAEWFENLGVGSPITWTFDPVVNAIVVQAGH
jgi:hypothetical protein